MFTLGRLDIGIRTRGAGTPPVPAAPLSTSAPAITGSPLVGASLSCSTGGWTGFPTPTFTYQWIWADTSANISGATSSTYTPVSGDLGHTLKCAVTATNSQGSATANSNTTAAVAALPANTVAPAITGSTNVGQTLSTTNGTWSNTPTSYAYQWKWADTGAGIPGATASTYVLVSGDVGHTIKCTVTATNAAGSASADSNTTAAVTAGVTPAFQVDFTAISVLPPEVSFSSASNEMVFDSTGKLTYAPNNLVLYSQDLSNAAWTQTNCTRIDGITDPDGGTTASRFTATGTAFIYNAVTAPPNLNSVASIWVRRVSGTGTVNQWTTDGSTGPALSLTNSWQRFGVSGSTTGGAIFVGIIISTSGDVIEVAKGQGEIVTYETTPRTYNATTTAAYYGPRFDHAWNGSAWVATGILIEEQRTNLFLQSGSPANQTVTVANGTSYTVSFYGTGSLALTGAVAHTVVGSGANVRTSYNFTSTTTSLVIAVSGSILYPNVEAGDFATSHIPTTTAAVTRSADIVQLAGAALAAMQASNWSVVMQTTDSVIGFFAQYLFEAPFSSGAGLLEQFGASSTQIATQDNTTSNNNLVATLGSGAVSGALQMALGRDASGRSFAVNGGTLVTDVNPSSIAGTGFYIGSQEASSHFANAHFARLAIYSSRLPDATLQAKSVVGAAF